MTRLCDRDIAAALEDGTIIVHPEPPLEAIQPASIDLHLGPEIQLYVGNAEAIDPLVGLGPDDLISTQLRYDRPWVLEPGDFILGCTIEKVSLPDFIGANIEGKSTLARLGPKIHSAGFIDPGFSGTLTLEIRNENHRRAILLRPGMRIAQLSFTRMSGSAMRPYGHPTLGSHYQHQTGATGPAPLAPVRVYDE